MDIQEAINNATAYQERYERLKVELQEEEQGCLIWRQKYAALSDAKIMLEYYQGYEEGVGWDFEKKEFREYRHVNGLITKLLNEAQHLKESSNLGERFSNRTFGNFDPRRDQRAFTFCKSYANTDNLFNIKKNGLLLLGGVGSGKTHLAAAISNELIDRGIPVLFGTFIEHLEHIKEEFDNTGQKKHLSMMKTTPLLVIDDLGKEKRTEWSQQILFDVVNYRYEHLLPIIITTNFDPDGIANHCGEAVWSRLYETCSAVETTGKDYRQ